MDDVLSDEDALRILTTDPLYEFEPPPYVPREWDWPTVETPGAIPVEDEPLPHHWCWGGCCQGVDEPAPDDGRTTYDLA